MTEEDIKKIEAINNSPNPLHTLLANILFEAQRQEEAQERKKRA